MQIQWKKDSIRSDFNKSYFKVVQIVVFIKENKMAQSKTVQKVVAESKQWGKKNLKISKYCTYFIFG